MFNLNSINRALIKESNRTKILNLVYNEEEITKQEIAKKLKLSIPTVISKVNELIEEGILEESGVAASTGGRKPVTVRFIKDSRFSFGVKIWSGETRVILTNLKSEIKADRRFSNAGCRDINDIVSKIKLTIENIKDEYNVPRENILGIGFSLPGTVDEDTLYLENATNLGIRNVDFRRFEEELQMPIYIENDANAAALAESILGPSKSKSSLIYLEISEGIGAGIVINGYLYKGYNKKAGEIGHMKISIDDLRCSCGRTGCWELYASERALLRDCNNKSKVKFESLEELFKKNLVGDELLRNILDRYLDYLAMGIQNIILTLAPEYVIVGGKISSYEDRLLKPLTEKVLLRSSFIDKSDTHIIFSKLKEDASILGASLLPLNSLFNYRKNVI